MTKISGGKMKIYGKRLPQEQNNNTWKNWKTLVKSLDANRIPKQNLTKKNLCLHHPYERGMK
jgi:hypothetical protein